MVMDSEKERLRTILFDTITSLCKNGLTYRSQFNISALIGITLDNDDVFLVDIRETVKNEMNDISHDDYYSENEVQDETNPQSVASLGKEMNPLPDSVNIKQEVNLDDEESMNEDATSQDEYTNEGLRQEKFDPLAIYSSGPYIPGMMGTYEKPNKSTITEYYRESRMKQNEKRSQKRKCLTLQEKYEVLQMSESGHKAMVIAAQFGVCKTQIYTILSRKDDIMFQWKEKSMNTNRKVLGLPRMMYPDVDEQVFQWYCETKSHNVAISPQMIRERAKVVAAALGHKDFIGSAGWVSRFQKRHNIGKVDLVQNCYDPNQSPILMHPSYSFMPVSMPTTMVDTDKNLPSLSANSDNNSGTENDNQLLSSGMTSEGNSNQVTDENQQSIPYDEFAVDVSKIVEGERLTSTENENMNKDNVNKDHEGDRSNQNLDEIYKNQFGWNVPSSNSSTPKTKQDG